MNAIQFEGSKNVVVEGRMAKADPSKPVWPPLRYLIGDKEVTREEYEARVAQIEPPSDLESVS